MGVVDIKNTLNNAAGDNFTFSRVSLSYSRGGLDQILSFKVTCKDRGITIPNDGLRSVTFSGQKNPIDQAIEIAMEYRRQLEE